MGKKLKKMGLLLLVFAVFAAASASIDPLKVVSNYAKYLESNDCDQWAKLFSPSGCKIDKPAPACGYKNLVAFW